MLLADLLSFARGVSDIGEEATLVLRTDGQQGENKHGVQKGIWKKIAKFNVDMIVMLSTIAKHESQGNKTKQNEQPTKRVK